MCGNVRTNGRRSGNYASYRCSGRHNKQGCHNMEIRRYYIDVYDEKVEVIFKVNFFDKEAGKIDPKIFKGFPTISRNPYLSSIDN